MRRLPPVTPRFVLLALLGVLVFCCLGYGAWLIIRLRHRHPEESQQTAVSQ